MNAFLEKRPPSWVEEGRLRMHGAKQRRLLRRRIRPRLAVVETHSWQPAARGDPRPAGRARPGGKPARWARTVAYVHCDVTNENEVKSAVTAALGQLGGLNLVVNCAGVIGAGRAVGREGPMPGELFVKNRPH